MSSDGTAADAHSHVRRSDSNRESDSIDMDEPAADSDPAPDVDTAQSGSVSPSGSVAESSSNRSLGFGRTGWLLTAALLGCILVIPLVLYSFPFVMGSAGVTFFAAYIALPFVPAVVLGAIAVWSMTGALEDT